MEFVYKAKNKEGAIVKGMLEAADRTSAFSSLRGKQLYPIEAKLKNESLGSLSFLNKRIPIKDKIIFSEQLAIMIKSGLSIIDALDALAGETENTYFASQIHQIITDIKGGTPLSKALSQFPDTFDEIYVNMVKSGEESGKVDMVLQRLAKQQDKDYELNRKIKGAMSYPIFVMITLVVVMTLVMTFVIPQLTSIFNDSGVPLPLLTRVIIATSLFLKKYVLYLAIGLIALIIFLGRYKKTKSGRKLYDTLIVKIPVFGTLMKKTYMARFTRTFAALVSSGLPLIDVMKVTANTVGNVNYQKEIVEMATQVKAGQPISKLLKESKYFPKMVGQLAIVGEKSGSLDEVFETLANFFERDVETITNNLSAMLEPILMVFMGAGVGIVIVSVIQPIYGMTNAI